MKWLDCRGIPLKITWCLVHSPSPKMLVAGWRWFWRRCCRCVRATPGRAPRSRTPCAGVCSRPPHAPCRGSSLDNAQWCRSSLPHPEENKHYQLPFRNKWDKTGLNHFKTVLDQAVWTENKQSKENKNIQLVSSIGICLDDNFWQTPNYVFHENECSCVSTVHCLLYK